MNLFDNTLYAATVDGCGGSNAVYAVDLATDEKTVSRFETGGGAVGSAGTAIGNDGTVYLHVGDRVLALTPKDLKEKDHFTLPPSGGGATDAAREGATPVVFRRNGKDVVVAASRDGRLFLLDSSALGGADHRTPLAVSQPAGAIRGAFASWEDPDTGSRWIYAPLASSPKAPNGGIAGFKLDDRNGRPVLTLEWTSREMIAPAAPAIANGLLFALSTGNPSRGAIFYILDATTGRQLLASGDAITGPASPETGLAVANGRVYFTTNDNTVYSFGIPTEH